ncbi:MAG: DUF6048 family protein [Bacteroidota bacterium]
MGKQLILFTFSLVFTFLVCAQEEEQPDEPIPEEATVDQPEEDSIQVSKRVLTPSIYIDYGKLLTIPSSQETKYEGGIELLFLEQFPLIIEAGMATLNPDQAFANGMYESTGMYYRVGTGYYSQFQPKNKLGVTLRYGTSTFDESSRINIISTSGVQDVAFPPIERESLTASWFEAVIYSDRKLSDLFAIGLNLRLRVLIDYDEQSPVDVYAIPGYGRSFDNSIPAANLFLKVSF